MNQSLKRAAWAYGCAKTGSTTEERSLAEMMQAVWLSVDAFAAVCAFLRWGNEL